MKTRTRTRNIAKVGIFGSKDNPQIVNEKDLKEIEVKAKRAAKSLCSKKS
jgi:hypothetical protein